jgi:hypothetical protein
MSSAPVEPADRAWCTAGMTRPSRNLLAAVIGGATIWLALTVAAAASDTVPDVEAWLDRPPPTGAPAGSTVQVGAVLWHRPTHTPLATSAFIRVHPASGGSPPIEVPASQDWPGHVVAQVTVPAGGFGRLEIGTAGSACTAGGCSRSDALYAVAGVGPPPGAPLTTIATAAVVPPAEQLVAGQPNEFEVVLVPRAAWDAAALPWPDALTLQVRRPREPVLAEAPVHLVDAASATYRGSIAVPEPGRFAFQVAAGTGDEAVFGASLVTLEVGEPTEPPGSAGDQAAMIALAIAALGGVVSVAVLVGMTRPRRGDP